MSPSASTGRVFRPFTIWHGERVLRVWKYTGWCAMCRDCTVGLIDGAESREVAGEAAQAHWNDVHTIEGIRRAREAAIAVAGSTR